MYKINFLSRIALPGRVGAALMLVAVLACNPKPDEMSHVEPSTSTVVHEPEPGETYFQNIRQLTFGGQNAEAYWSPDGTQLIFQRMTARPISRTSASSPSVDKTPRRIGRRTARS
jgi:hypothetical protein